MAEALRTIPKPVLFLIVSFLFPSELSLYLGDIRLPPHRVVLLAFFPVVVYRLLMRPDIRLQGWDYVFVLFGAWTTYAYYAHTGDSSGFVFGASQALDSIGAFFLTRAFVRTPEQCLAALKSMIAAIAVAGLIALPETLFGELYMHNLMRELTGIVQPTGIDKRMGLTRAYSTFDHPIHYGTFCAGLFAFFWAAERRNAIRARRTGIVAGATFLGLSSAPLLSLVMQTAMLLWERFTRGIAMRTPITVAIIVGMYIGASLVSNRSPVHLIATGLTFESWTGFYRIQIWTHGLENVWAHPWLGIGQADWERPAWMVSSTIDAFWLVITIRSGIPSFLLLVVAILLLGRAVVVRGIQTRDERLRRISTGWMMSLIALCFVGITVHYWNVLFAYFFFFLGLAGWIADPSAWKAKAHVSAGTGAPAMKRVHPSLRPVRQPGMDAGPALPPYAPVAV